MYSTVKEAVAYRYATTIVLEFGGLNTVMDWCKEHCIGEWHLEYAGHQDSPTERKNVYKFDFTNEVDFITFNLKYK